MLIFHQHILLIACEPSLNLMTNYLIYVAGKQWEILQFTIEVCSSMVLWLKHIIVQLQESLYYLGFLQFGLAHVGPAVRCLDPLFNPFCIWGNEMSMNISQVKKLRKIVRMKKLATNNSKIFVCTMKKTSVNYRMVLTLLPCFYPLHHFKIYNSDLCMSLFLVLFKAVRR